MSAPIMVAFGTLRTAAIAAWNTCSYGSAYWNACLFSRIPMEVSLHI